MEGIFREMNIIAKDQELGQCATEAKLIYEKTVVPSISYNLEMWTKMREKDWERLERVQAKVLKRMLGLPKATPYWGILAETGIWPIKAIVQYHRLMFYQDVMTSEETRLAKEL